MNRIEKIISDAVHEALNHKHQVNVGKIATKACNQIAETDPLHQLAVLLQTQYHATIHITKSNQSDYWDIKLLGINNTDISEVSGPDPYKLIRKCIDTLTDNKG